MERGQGVRPYPTVTQHISNTLLPRQHMLPAPRWKPYCICQDSITACHTFRYYSSSVMKYIHKLPPIRLYMKDITLDWHPSTRHSRRNFDKRSYIHTRLSWHHNIFYSRLKTSQEWAYSSPDKPCYCSSSCSKH